MPYKSKHCGLSIVLVLVVVTSAMIERADMQIVRLGISISKRVAVAISKVQSLYKRRIYFKYIALQLSE